MEKTLIKNIYSNCFLYYYKEVQLLSVKIIIVKHLVICCVALVSSLQSTDAGAGMTKALRENKDITGNELLIFTAFQFTAGGLIGNYLASGSALFTYMTVPISVPLAVMFVMKMFGANMMRAYCKFFVPEEE